MVQYSNVDPKQPHVAFFGRWCPPHTGHTWIVEKMYAEKNLPVLILVRDTSFDQIRAPLRAELVATWMKTKNIAGTVMIIPDIEGVYYGRGVGYNVEEIKPPEHIKVISATEIRKRIAENDNSWRNLVAEGTADLVQEIFAE